MTASQTSAESPELLPCPFCGGNGAVTFGVRRDAVKTVDVICQQCSGAMLAFCEEDAIADWNTRPQPAGLAQKFDPCPGCDGHECDDGCSYPGAVRRTSAVAALASQPSQVAEERCELCDGKWKDTCSLCRGTGTQPPALAQGSSVRDLPLIWKGWANALRLMDSKRSEPQPEAQAQADAYDQCATELREALGDRTPAATAQGPKYIHAGTELRSMTDGATYREMAEAPAWQCTDERYPYIKGLVTVRQATMEAWRDGDIEFVSLYPLTASRTPAETDEITVCHKFLDAWNENRADYIGDTPYTVSDRIQKLVEDWQEARGQVERSQWQPIETKPRDHFPVLVYGPFGQLVAFLDVTWMWWPFPAGEDGPLDYTPTHWRPLPDRPQDSSTSPAAAADSMREPSPSREAKND